MYIISKDIIMAHIKCKFCGKEVYRRPSRLAITKNTFCSRVCQGDFIRSIHPEGNCVCEYCGNKFRTNPAYIRRTPKQKRFCSKICHGKYRDMLYE